MKRALLVTVFTILICSFSFAQTANACYFFFNHSGIETSLGTTGTIAVRVLIDHSDCSLEGKIEGMEFAWDNIEVTAFTDWKLIGDELYERAFSVTLSEVGTGFFKIFKDCSREGYADEVVPITVLPGGAIWESALMGNYPYTTPPNSSVVTGSFSISDKQLSIKSRIIELPRVPHNLANYAGEITVFYVDEQIAEAVLIVGPDFYYRF